jgi:hypothetical protein
MLAGSTASSMLVTVNGTLVGVPALDVGVGVLPLPPPLVPQADTATASRQQQEQRSAGQREPLWMRACRRWRARDRIIVVSPG